MPFLTGTCSARRLELIRTLLSRDKKKNNHHQCIQLLPRLAMPLFKFTLKFVLKVVYLEQDIKTLLFFRTPKWNSACLSTAQPCVTLIRVTPSALLDVLSHSSTSNTSPTERIRRHPSLLSILELRRQRYWRQDSEHASPGTKNVMPWFPAMVTPADHAILTSES